eukprot:863026-Prymnesium_polylepis.2
MVLLVFAQRELGRTTRPSEAHDLDTGLLGHDVDERADADPELHNEHGEPKEDEEEVDARRGGTKAIRVADGRRDVARLDEEDADVDEDERQLDQHHDRPIFTSFERLDGEVERQEHDAHQKRHQDAGLLRALFDQQDPSGQGQLAAHL